MHSLCWEGVHGMLPLQLPFYFIFLVQEAWKDIDNLDLELHNSEFKQCKALFADCVTVGELIHFADPYFLNCKKIVLHRVAARIK